MHIELILIIVACLIGFVMTWGVGANDLANIMSPTLGSRAVTVRQAMIIAIIFEFAGALLGGNHVTTTIRTGIINLVELNGQPDVLIYGMLSTLLAGATWMLLASFLGMPVSITNAIVGGLVGFGGLVLGVHAIHWSTVGQIATSWVCSPLIAALASFLLFNLIRRTIFNADQPAHSMRRSLPMYFVLVGLVLTNMTLFKGLQHAGYHLTLVMSIMINLVPAIIIAIIGTTIGLRIKEGKQHKRFLQINYVERLFSLLMAFTACAMIFAHGSNDVAIAMGPVSAIISMVMQGHIAGHAPLWIMAFGCLGVVTGLLMYGRKVIITVGSKITDLTPSRAFAATLAAATTVIGSTSTGIPVSATQTLVGGVLGVGLARGIGALNLKVVRNILLSWFVTIPATAALNIGFFYMFMHIL